MPGLNGKGPLGKGPMTGGQRGICRQSSTNKAEQSQDTPMDNVQGQGKGQGGAGRGAGKGRRRGGNR
jgi:hypothetical protein